MNGRKKKLAIFDLDGTLTDTLESIQISVNKTLEVFNIPPVEIDYYRYFVGDGAKELLRRTLKHVNVQEEEMLEEVQKVYSSVFEEYCRYHVHPYDGILELLSSLKEKNVKLAVLSNKPHLRTIEVVEEFFGDNCFDMIQGQCDELPKKPSPEGIFKMAEKFLVEKEEIIYLGDTNTDMLTGKNAGVFTVGALWGFRDRKELEENHADAVIEHPMELLQFIGEPGI